MWIRKEEGELSLFVGDGIIYVENPKSLTNER